MTLFGREILYKKKTEPMRGQSNKKLEIVIVKITMKDDEKMDT